MRGIFAVKPVEGVTKITTMPGVLGSTVGAVFVIAPPRSKSDNPPQPIYAFIGAPATSKRMVDQIKKMADPANLPHFKDSALLVTGAMEAIRTDLWASDEDQLSQQEKRYIEIVDEHMTYGPDGLTGSAGIYVQAQTIDLVADATVPFRCEVATDSVQYWHEYTDYPKNKTVKIASNGNIVAKVQPSLPSFITKGVKPKNINIWGAFETVTKFLAEGVSSGQRISLEGRLIRKVKDGFDSLSINATFVFPHMNTANTTAPVADQVESAASKSTTLAAVALGIGSVEEDDY